MQRQFASSLKQVVAQYSTKAPVKYARQTFASPVHDGWAGKHLPFSLRTKWGFFTKAVIFVSTGFWIPFFVVDFHLRKAAQ
ncbi:unnamed protein product [Dracunculus medinensis]|uniref:Cytochrome c oxidase polypeptide VIIc n=1 Tax=Dracunculus medinensis TaxID=318479 RepID=A0A0N4UIF1_DRAME|nr:unnamed protein product [Dracunculus medinensis]